MKITENHITADAGMALRCLWDGRVYGREVWLGYSYFKNGRKLKKPRLLRAEDFEEMEDPVLAAITLQSLGLDGGSGYAEVKAAVVKTRYTVDDQIALMLNHAADPQRYAGEYDEMQAWRTCAGLVAGRLTGKEADDDNL